MALSDLTVYSEYVYTTLTETVAQQIQLFNDASRGALQLRSAKHQGDYSDEISWAFVSGLVRRRNAYGTASVSGKVLTNHIETMVKVAAGTPPIDMAQSQFNWIQINPAEAGTIMGQQLAAQTLADMVNTAIAATDTALNSVSAVKSDTSTATDGTQLATFVNLNLAAMKFGDRSNAIVAWIMHSKPVTDLYTNALTNAEKLFLYDTVSVIGDPFGRRFIVTDSPALVKTGSPNKYHTLGLVPGAARVDQNDDLVDNWQSVNGNENILRTYQAEWSYSLGVKGFTWDKTNGGHSPTDAAITTAGNWDQIATSIKDIAGVLMITQ